MDRFGSFPKIVVAVVIAVLIVVSLAIPVIADYQGGTTTTYTNNGLITMSKVGDSTVTASFDENGFTIGEDVITKNVNIFVFDCGSVAYNNGAVLIRYTIDSTTQISGGGATTGEFSITSDTLTYKFDSNQNVTVPIKWCFYYDDYGEYVYNYNNNSQVDTVIYDTDNPLYLGFSINTSPKIYTSSIGGEVNDNADGVTLTYNATKIVNNNDVYKINVGFGESDTDVYATYSDTDYHPTWAIVKASFTSTEMPSPMLSSMFGIIPLLMIVGIVIATVSAIALRKE